MREEAEQGLWDKEIVAEFFEMLRQQERAA